MPMFFANNVLISLTLDIHYNMSKTCQKVIFGLIIFFYSSLINYNKKNMPSRQINCIIFSIKMHKKIEAVSNQRSFTPFYYLLLHYRLWAQSLDTPATKPSLGSRLGQLQQIQQPIGCLGSAIKVEARARPKQYLMINLVGYLTTKDQKENHFLGNSLNRGEHCRLHQIIHPPNRSFFSRKYFPSKEPAMLLQADKDHRDS